MDQEFIPSIDEYIACPISVSIVHDTAIVDYKLINKTLSRVKRTLLNRNIVHGIKFVHGKAMQP